MLRSIFFFIARTYTRFRRYLDKRLYDDRHQIDTAERVSLEELGVAGENREEYAPTSWLDLKRAFKLVNIGADDVFLDIGCGKGRVVYHAATYPLRKVIGVEISPALAATARSNIERSLPKLRCKNVEIVVCDALGYDIPDEVTIVYLYDPFHGDIFKAVLQKLQASLGRRPRELTIFYLDPYEDAALHAAGARLVSEKKGFRPSKDWAKEKAIRVYKLGPLVSAPGA